MTSGDTPSEPIESWDDRTETTSADDPSRGFPEAELNASIVQIHGDDLGKRYAVEGELTLGRAYTNDVVLAVDNVSRHHAQILQRDGETLLVDRGSTNGTSLNDSTVIGETVLEHGDLIKIGKVIFRFISGDHAEAHYHEEIYRLAITDGLTGLNNRRYFDDFLEREVARSLRSGAQLSLILFDIDEFKELNDQHGHLFGDRVLQEVAKCVREKVRREQLLARFGGDEFAIVLPDVDLDGALAFAERVRTLVSELGFGERFEGAQATLSVGVAALEPSMTITDLMETADQALYAAKAEGRNCVRAV